MKDKVCLFCVLTAIAALTGLADEARASGEIMTVTLPGGVAMEMVWCAPGSFVMGSPENESGRFADEPQRNVTITKGFWIGRHEVTQRQWSSVMRDNPSRFKDPDGPVDNISWHDCAMFLRKVNVQHDGWARMPTEAEWEYACRAGAFGMADVNEVAWYDSNSGNQTHVVGQKLPNAWGLYDMRGNVLEWCSDWYSVPKKADVIDPAGPPSGSFKVLRGGCWFFYERDCRIACRLKREPHLRNCIFGFRMAYSDPAAM